MLFEWTHAVLDRVLFFCDDDRYYNRVNKLMMCNLGLCECGFFEQRFWIDYVWVSGHLWIPAFFRNTVYLPLYYYSCGLRL